VDKTKRAIRLTIVAAVVILGVGPSCTTDDTAIQAETYGYGGQYRGNLGTGPGIGCQRVPPPTQC
jgi:hypothetical protein